MARLFGTDGVRGIANKELTGQLAFQIGQAAAMVLTGGLEHKPVIAIGKDTRFSGDMLELALAAGITSAGADVLLAGILPTPAVALLTREGCDAGVVVSASHNPYEYNGIKIFAKGGQKLTDTQEDEIEAIVSGTATGTPHPSDGGLGSRIGWGKNIAERYADYLLSCCAPDLSKLRIVIDCANGAASGTARLLFQNTKELRFIHNKPNGMNINDRCGSTDMESLQEAVVSGGYDAGIAFDGDADRCLCVDHTGKVINGDMIMAVCALREYEGGHLPGGTFVSTVMSNLGLYEWVKAKGLHTISAAVGDRYVLEEMRKGSYLVGGEQSGHIVFARHSTTGDGQLAALKLLSAMTGTGKSLAELTGEIPVYPQVLLNVHVTPECKEKFASDKAVAEAMAKAEEALGENGRILVRASGTEPLVRVMAEGKDGCMIARLAEEIAGHIRNCSTPNVM
jgi:phosphoglucosamine mutase